MTIRFLYWDAVGNEYPPAERKITIIDRRKNRANPDVDIPLKIVKIDDGDAYKNVEHMEIGACG